MVNSPQSIEELKLKRTIVVSVGMYPYNAIVAIMSIGVGPGDVIILVNSEPRRIEDLRPRGGRMQPEDAMNQIRKIILDNIPEVDIKDVWLSPSRHLADNVALLRTLVESLAPTSVTIAIAGGLRWLSVVLMFLAMALKTIGGYTRVNVEDVFVMLEEESPSIKRIFPGIRERIIHWPIIPALTSMDKLEYEILRIITSKEDGIKAKEIIQAINGQFERSRRPSKASIERKLTKLRRKGVITYEKVGKAYIYKPTDLGKILTKQYTLQ
ncbi:CRISPR-associated CARF protein Csa3 [Caldivirga maquilingensis]|uniref:Transcriptional repressor, CopY family n=1 Tax=Caldivirga maquilingensis (strain ATCC 700844 / DSM 13496 / JCM 10307 / IC-167) TaxID=397948 RepID=A8M9C5_CALMQ|nr:CRISPR-associated CARF protein Csa3 [Caldivirga maquilingensis]ABW02344.1 transcriptional repressor, CopY family [Caldivirga maquilingensis IC-167]